MKYYRSTITGKTFNETDLLTIKDVYGFGAIEKAISEGVIEEIDPPSVVDFLRVGMKARATRRYREIHNCTLKEAYDAVNHMEDQMEKLQKK